MLDGILIPWMIILRLAADADACRVAAALVDALDLGFPSRLRSPRRTDQSRPRTRSGVARGFDQQPQPDWYLPGFLLFDYYWYARELAAGLFGHRAPPDMKADCSPLFPSSSSAWATSGRLDCGQLYAPGRPRTLAQGA